MERKLLSELWSKDGCGRMKTIHCPKDIGFINTFDGENCKREQFYNDCYHCWASNIAEEDEIREEQAKIEQLEHDILYEPTFSEEEGSM